MAALFLYGSYQTDIIVITVKDPAASCLSSKPPSLLDVLLFSHFSGVFNQLYLQSEIRKIVFSRV